MFRVFPILMAAIVAMILFSIGQHLVMAQTPAKPEPRQEVIQRADKPQIDADIPGKLKKIRSESVLSECYGDIANRMADTAGVSQRLAARLNQIVELLDKIDKIEAENATLKAEVEALKQTKPSPPKEEKKP